MSHLQQLEQLKESRQNNVSNFFGLSYKALYMMQLLYKGLKLGSLYCRRC